MNNERRAIVASGFPGVGKSVFYDKNKNTELVVLDSDSSKFSWVANGKRNPDFPNNYMEHIKDNLNKADVILVSSHDVVREALKQERLEYVIVYPERNLKSEYLQRYAERGSGQKFLDLLESKWDEFLDEIEKESFPKKIVLRSGQFISDVLQV